MAIISSNHQSTADQLSINNALAYELYTVLQDLELAAVRDKEAFTALNAQLQDVNQRRLLDLRFRPGFTESMMELEERHPNMPDSAKWDASHVMMPGLTTVTTELLEGLAFLYWAQEDPEAAKRAKASRG